MNKDLNIENYLDDEGILAVPSNELIANGVYTPESLQIAEGLSVRDRYSFLAQSIDGIPLYDTLKSRQRNGLGISISMIASLLPKINSSSPRIADIGCGTGLEATYLARELKKANGGLVFALDFVKNMLDYTVKRARKYDLDNVIPILSDRDNLPFRNNSLDALFCVSSIYEGDPEFYGLSALFQRNWLLSHKLRTLSLPLKSGGIISLFDQIIGRKDDEKYLDYYLNNDADIWHAIMESQGFSEVRTDKLDYINIDGLLCKGTMISGRKK